MPEFSVENLHDIHTNLTAAGIAEYTSIASDATRLEARIDVARDTILTLTRERDALREQANAAHAALDEAGAPACDGVLSGRITALADKLSTAQADLAQTQAENAPLRARRNALHDALARMGNALSAAGHHAGFGLDEVEQALAAALAERNTLSAALTEAGTVNSRLAADLSRAQTERDAARAELAQTKAQLDVANADFEAGADDYEIVSAERDTLRADLTEAGAANTRLAGRLVQAEAENARLRARLAERPAPPDHRDPPVSTAAEEAIERLWGTLYALGGDLDRADFADGIEGIADAVEAALSLNLEQIRTLTDERDHAGRLAMEQFRCRLHRT